MSASAEPANREGQLAIALVELADTLVADFDVVDLLDRLTQHCVTLLDASAAGLLLADGKGALRVIAASSEASRDLELFQLQNSEGPCSDCYRTGSPVVVEDLTEMRPVWPRFASLAEAAGYRSVHALPMRLRSDVVGTLNLFRSGAGRLSEADRRAGQALADMATIGILQNRSIQRNEVLAEQLRSALQSRVLIEQAKGVLAERGGVDVERAFQAMRHFARSNNLRLLKVAESIVERGEMATTVLGSGKQRRQP